ncbi:GNAT family N-acetyltransferase [Marinobacter salicampi]|uniref:GNAT family N-acetyltransferase n=1 Tax=Marinobacter salicampi TaxID=435907 RepID=UPI001408297D|nr:GNAT family N-acetyltransferase [Marinobacter salicampi]
MTQPATPGFCIKTLSSITEIPEALWDSFSDGSNPFLRHRFLSALETTGCTTAATGWAPAHLVFYHHDRPVGVSPAYLKSHSMGEYVFDWAWADAFERYGLEYYPKLLIAIPFTPSEGPRLLLEPGFRSQLTAPQLEAALDSVAGELGVHSWHLLFPDEADQELLVPTGKLQRLGCQFHWYNRGYQSFEDFLATLTSRKRKSIRKERRQVEEQDIGFIQYPGTGLPDHVLKAFYVFYQATYLKRGQRPYLNLAFFQALTENQPEQVHITMAVKDGQMIAGALFLHGGGTLYGRYWGCLEEYSHLHFETCYYQGIELAIARGLHCFDAGAQGEHKLVRGFEPELTHSWHWVFHPGFEDALDQFCREERAQTRAYRQAALAALPYRQAD